MKVLEKPPQTPILGWGMITPTMSQSTLNYRNCMCRIAFVISESIYGVWVWGGGEDSYGTQSIRELPTPRDSGVWRGSMTRRCHSRLERPLNFNGEVLEGLREHLTCCSGTVLTLPLERRSCTGNSGDAAVGQTIITCVVRYFHWCEEVCKRSEIFL